MIGLFRPRTGPLSTILPSSLRVGLVLTIALFAPSAWADYLPLEDVATGVELRVWANDGGEKIPREILRTTDTSDAVTSLNSIWNGAAIETFAARNEIVSVAVVIDNNGVGVDDVELSVSALETADTSYSLATTEFDTATMFDWRERPIEIFVVEYLKVHGLSFISYATYDETHIPFHLQRPIPNDLHPIGAANVGEGVWADRPYHDLSYPDIAIPQEVQALNGGVSIAPQTSQIFWIDIYVPADAPAGILSGTVTLSVPGLAPLSIPLSLEVYDFALPAERHAKTMVYIEPLDIKKRYFTGTNTPLAPADHQAFRDVMNRHFRLAWRHGVSLFDANELLPDTIPPIDNPNIDWEERLTASFYSAENGYAGPWADQPHDIFVIGSYGAWAYWWDLRQFNPVSETFDPDADEQILQSVLEEKTGIWETWFQTNAPDTTRFLYVDDEPTITLEFAERVAGYVENSPTAGSELGTFITASPLDHADDLPSPSIFASLIAVAPTQEWEAALAARPDRTYYMYNGRRPASGSFATDDDGVALRSLAWAQYKKDVDRWFYWHSTYYNNIQGGAATRDMSLVAGGDGESYRNGSETNVFKSAHTFGGHDRFEDVFGERGFNYGNGDGLLFYPGTDYVFPDENLGLNGPIASLRLKHWRRGIQDVQYLELAKIYEPTVVAEIVQRLIPEALWEIGVQLVSDPTYVNKAPSWSIDPDDWEEARRELAEIIRIGMLPFAPTISTQPADTTAFTGDIVLLTVVASGNPAPTYQWFKDDVEIPDAIFAGLSLQAVSAADSGSYYVVVTNEEGTVTSDTVTLEVVPALTSPEITTQPQSLELQEGAPATFSVLAEGNPEPEFQWQKAGVDIADAIESSYSIAAVVLADAGSYSVLVSNSQGSVTSEVAELTVEAAVDAPVFVVQPLDTQALAGQTVTLEVAATGTPEPLFQWMRDGVALPGETSTTLSFVAQPDDAGQYSVLASNAGGSVESAAAEVTVDPVVADIAMVVRDVASLRGGEQRIRDTLLGLGHTVNMVSDSANLAFATVDADLIVIPGTARAAAVGAAFAQDPRPVWNSQSVAFDDLGFVAGDSSGPFGRVNGQQFINLIDNQSAIGDGLPLGELQVIDRDRTFVWGVPPTSAQVIATLSGDPTRATIFTFEPDDLLADGSAAAGRRVAWYGNGYVAARWNAAGVQLFEQSIGWLLGAVQVTTSAPVITEQPVDVSAPAGTDVNFSAVAFGQPTPSLQWLKDGAPVAGATSAELQLVASSGTAGVYQLTATNSEGTTASDAVTLALEVDSQPPELLSAVAQGDESVLLTFSEAITAATAEIAGNYLLNNGISVLTAAQLTPASVSLGVSPLPAATSFLVTVNNLADESGNVIALDTQASFATALENLSIALVVGSTQPLAVADVAWRDKLVELGYSVELFLDRNATSANTVAHTAVVISGTARGPRIGNALVNDPRPIMIGELYMYPEMGLVAQGDVGILPSQATVDLLDNQSIGVGFAIGELTVTTKPRRINWGAPGTGAQVFATVTNDANRAVVFGYSAGSALANGNVASGKRLAWHGSNLARILWSDDGEVLFEQALAWLVTTP